MSDTVLAAARAAIERCDWDEENRACPWCCLLLESVTTALAHEQQARQSAERVVADTAQGYLQHRARMKELEAERDLARTEIAEHHAVFATLEAERDTLTAWQQRVCAVVQHAQSAAELGLDVPGILAGRLAEWDKLRRERARLAHDLSGLEADLEGVTEERDTAAARVAELEADVLRLEQQRYADRHALPEDPLLEAIPEKDAQ